MSTADTGTTLREKPVVLISGSSGLIGERLARALGDGYTVIGMDVKPPQSGSAVADFLECDLTDQTSVLATFTQLRQKYGDHLASMIHLAAYYDFAGEPSPLYHDLTVTGTRRVLSQLQTFRCEQFVFSSTLLVMRPSEDGSPINEESPIQPEWDYPQSKVAAELAIHATHQHIHTVILRMAGVYDEDCHSIPISQQISRIYEKKLESYLYPGNQDHGQSFVHLDDLADCVRRAVDRRTQLNMHEVFLIGERDLMSYGELQDRIGELLHGKEWPTIRIPKVVAKAGAWAKEKVPGEEAFIKPWMIDLADAHYPVDSSRAEEALEWFPKHRLRDTLDEMIRRLKQDPQGWYHRNKLKPPT